MVKKKDFCLRSVQFILFTSHDYDKGMKSFSKERKFVSGNENNP